MIARIAALILLLLASPALAQTSPRLSGLRVDTLPVFDACNGVLIGAGTSAATCPTTVPLPNLPIIPMTKLAGFAVSGGIMTWDLAGALLQIGGNINAQTINMLSCKVYGIECVVQTQAVSLNAASSVVDGMKVFGDSFSANKGASATDNGWAATVAREYNLSRLYKNYAVEGYTNVDIQTRLFNNLTPAATGNPIVTIFGGANDVSYIANGYYRAAYQTGLFASAAFAGLASTDVLAGNSPNTVVAGAWANDTTFSSIVGKKSSTAGATYTVNIFSPNGIVYLFYGSYYSSGGTFAVTLNSTPAADQVTGLSTLSSQLQSANLANPYLTSIGTTQGVAMARYVVPANSMTTLQVTVTSASGAGNPVTIYGVGIPPAAKTRGLTAPRVFLAGAVRQPDDTNGAATAILDAANRTVAQTLQGDGLNVNFVDVRKYLNQSIDLGNVALQNCAAVASGYYGHPNDCGHRRLAQAFQDAINAQPLAFTDGAAPPAQPQFRNRIINGGPDVWQRGTSFTVAHNAEAFVADHWLVTNQTGASATVSRVTPPAGFRAGSQYAMQFQSTANANGYALFSQRFEARNVADLDGKAAVMTFDMVASGSGALTGVVYILPNNAVDNGTYATAGSVAYVVPTTGTRVSVAIPSSLMANAKYGLQVSVYIAPSSAGAFSVAIGSAQFEADRQLANGAWGNPTDFELLPFATVLAQSQRYYYRRSASAAYDIISTLSAVGGASAWGKLFDLPVEMRVDNAVVGISSAGHLSLFKADKGAEYPLTDLGVAKATKRSITIFSDLSAGGGPAFTAGQSLGLLFNSASGWIDVSAEL